MGNLTVFNADLASATTPLQHPWQWCVGSGHATLGLRADWQAQLAQARRDFGFRHVRFHGLLDDDMGTLIRQGGELLYSFFNVDRIFDFVLSIGMKPCVELSFMPHALASGNAVVFHYQGNITPPKDYSQWAELVRRLAVHWVDRYGIDEVAQWPIECWNEPNLGAFWAGSRNAWFELYRVTAEALKSVDKRLRIGGPVTAANGWLDDFNAYCKQHDVPADFISTHLYPTDAFGKPGADTITQLEHSPPHVMLDRAVEARAAAGQRPLYYTEWSISSNPRDSMHDGSFAAAFATRIVMSVDSVVDGYSWWTFTDVFEENYFPSAPFHGGFGLMNLYGVPKPVYRAFEMLRALGDATVDVSGKHATVALWVGTETTPRDATRSNPHDAAQLAPGGESESSVVLINQALPRHAIEREAVRLRIAHRRQRRPVSVQLMRIDAEHANPERAWRDMGAPDSLKPAQVEALMAASRVTAEPLAFRSEPGMLEIDLELAAQSANRLRIDWLDAA